MDGLLRHQQQLARIRATQPAVVQVPPGERSEAGAALRVCFVTYAYPPEPGGLARSARRIVGYLDAAGFAVDVFAPWRPCWRHYPLSIEPDEHPPVHRPRRIGSVRAIVDAQRDAVEAADRRLGYDLFHAFFLPTLHALGPALARRRRPVIASIRGDDAVSWLADERSELIEPGLAHVDCVTSVCHDLLGRVVPRLGTPVPCPVIANGVEPAARPWTIDGVVRGRVGTVGLFQPKKGLPVLARSYGAVPGGLRRELRLVGDFTRGDDRVCFDEAVSAAGISAETWVTGLVRSPAAVRAELRRLNVFVQPSLHDGFPNALLEAAAVGVPLVATNVGGMADALEHGRSALLVPPGDAGALTSAIAAVLADDRLAQALSRGARAMAAAHSPDRERRAWLKVYADATGCAPPSRSCRPRSGATGA